MNLNKAPQLRLINPSSHCSFIIKEEPFDLETSWHYHLEIEIMYFKTGSVSGIMGNRFTEFESDEMVLLGSNFPHVIFENKDYSSKFEQIPEGIVIQFSRDFLGAEFFKAPEMSKVNTLLSKSKNGIRFKSDTVMKVKDLLEGISLRTSSRQLIDLLEILVILADEEKNSTHMAVANEYNRSELDEDRMHIVKKYIYDNFRDKIKVSDVASLVNMTETSFCRYYKNKTLKSLTRTLNEIRISYACEMLRREDCNVTEACYQSGFTSPAFFSRTFRKIVGMSPSEYKSDKNFKKVLRW